MGEFESILAGLGLNLNLTLVFTVLLSMAAAYIKEWYKDTWFKGWRIDVSLLVLSVIMNGFAYKWSGMATVVGGFFCAFVACAGFDWVMQFIGKIIKQFFEIKSAIPPKP